MSKRGVYKSTNYLSTNKVQLIFYMPLGEIIYDFFEKLKSTSKGYASFDYEITENQNGELVKLDVRIAGEIVDALSIIVHKDNAYRQGSSLCKKLKDQIHRQHFLSLPFSV